MSEVTNKESINSQNLNILYMLYNSVNVRKVKHLDIYNCSSEEDESKYIKENFVVIHNTITDKTKQYEKIEEITNIENLLFIQKDLDIKSLRYTLIIFDIDTTDEIVKYKDVHYLNNITDDLFIIVGMQKSYLYSIKKKKTVLEFVSHSSINGDKVVFGCEDKILIYKPSTQEIIETYDCKCTISNRGNAIGKSYKFINLGTSGIFIDIRSQEIVEIVHNNNYNMEAESYKNSYCDLTVFTGPGGKKGAEKYLYDDNYFICGNKIMRTKEFLELLTIEEIKPAYKKGTDEVKHYDIITSKGFKGKLSKNFRNLYIDNVLNGENILDIRFEFIREKYLI